MQFKETVRAPWTRPNGLPGFRVFQKGRTPESYSLTDEETDVLAPQLVEGAGVAVDDSITAEEVLDQSTKEQRIVFAIASMLKEDPDKKDEDLWTAKGLPRVEAIERLIDESITTADRDTAWQVYEGVN